MAPLQSCDMASIWCEATVVCWDVETFNVLCPYCKELEAHPLDIHKLPYTEYGDSKRVREALCPGQVGLKYVIIWPIDCRQYVNKTGLTWELDHANHRYKTVGPGHYVELDDYAKQRRRYIEAKHLCAPRGLKDVDTEGNTRLILATRDGNLRSMTSLLKSGVDINATNDLGWSSLHQAAYWGRTEAAILLLKYGISRDLSDYMGRKAYDIALIRRFVDDKEISGGFEMNHHGVNERKKYIAELLKPKSLQKTKAHRDLLAMASYRTPTSCSTESSRICGFLSILAPISTLRVNQVLNKTLGALIRGHNYPILWALSGWKDIDENLGSWDILENEYWTEEVFRVYREMNHPIDPGRDVQGRPGQANASHVEKKLAVAFVRKHCFHQTQLLDRDIRGLKRIQPPNPLNEATIRIDGLACPSCLKFIKKIEEVFHVTIHIERMHRTIDGQPFTVEGVRTPSRKSSRTPGQGIMTPPSSGKYWDAYPALLPKSKKRVRLEAEDTESEATAEEELDSPGILTMMDSPETPGSNTVTLAVEIPSSQNLKRKRHIPEDPFSP